MVYYKRRGGYRKRYYRKRGYGANRYCKPKAMDYARAAYSGVKYLKGLVNSEVFKHNVTIAAGTSSTGSVTHLSGIAIGDGDSTRTGNSIFTKYLSFRANVAVNPSATATILRMVIFQDKQQVGDGTPAVSDVLETSSVVSSLNQNSVGRFKIIRDINIALNDTVINKYIKRYIKIKTHIRYNGTAGSDIQRGGLYCLLISNEATNAPGIDMDMVLGYHDN